MTSGLQDKQPVTSQPSVASSTATLQEVDQNKLNVTSLSRSASRVSRSSGNTQATVRDQSECDFTPKYCSSVKPGAPTLRDARSVVSRAATRMSQSQRATTRMSQSQRAMSRMSSAGSRLAAHERSFQYNQTVKEIFKMKIESAGKKKHRAFKLWLRCVDYQFSSETVKRYKKVEIKKRFVTKDDLFSMNVYERSQLLEAGVSKVKEAALKVFWIEFAQFVGSHQYKNICK